jgi:hypothetical protein
LFARIFDERDAAVKKIAQVIAACRAEEGFLQPGTQRLAGVGAIPRGAGHRSISLNPDTALKTSLAILATNGPPIAESRRTL